MVGCQKSVLLGVQQLPSASKSYSSSPLGKDITGAQSFVAKRLRGVTQLTGLFQGVSVMHPG